MQTRLLGMKMGIESVVAQRIAKALRGNSWDVAACDWWVTVQSDTLPPLILLTNDPLGIDFRPKKGTPAMLELRHAVFKELISKGFVSEDGSWAPNVFE